MYANAGIPRLKIVEEKLSNDCVVIALMELKRTISTMTAIPLATIIMPIKLSFLSNFSINWTLTIPAIKYVITEIIVVTILVSKTVFKAMLMLPSDELGMSMAMATIKLTIKLANILNNIKSLALSRPWILVTAVIIKYIRGKTIIDTEVIKPQMLICLTAMILEAIRIDTDKSK